MVREALDTARLKLVVATEEILRAELRGRNALAEALGVSVPENWPPELYDHDAMEWMLHWAEESPDDLEWGLRYVVESATANLVGVIGYKGRPLDDGTVEIGYSVLEQFQRRGFAGEAASALISNAFASDSVTRVVAETLPDLIASQRVMEKNGLSLVGPGSEEGVIRYELRRSDWRPER